jgi:hypothetical protein
LQVSVSKKVLLTLTAKLVRNRRGGMIRYPIDRPADDSRWTGRGRERPHQWSLENGSSGIRSPNNRSPLRHENKIAETNRAIGRLREHDFSEPQYMFYMYSHVR